MSSTGRSTCTYVTLFTTAALLAAAAPLAAQRGPAPVMTHLPGEVIAQACAPSLVFELPMTSLLVTGGQDASTRHSFGPGDLITINGGSDNGIEVGQQFYVRRVQPPRGSGISRQTPAAIRTSGWVRVYATKKTMSLVTVEHACGEPMNIGDYLVPFSLPTVPTPDPNPPKQQEENYGHILIGTDRRTMFSKNDFFTVDRGSDHGVTVGARFIVYRDKRKMDTLVLSALKELPDTITTPEFLFEMGEAVAVAVTPEVSTLRAMISRDAFVMGDYVALRK